jgi:hypothetical protein
VCESKSAVDFGQTKAVATPRSSHQQELTPWCDHTVWPSLSTSLPPTTDQFFHGVPPSLPPSTAPNPTTNYRPGSPPALSAPPTTSPSHPLVLPHPPPNLQRLLRMFQLFHRGPDVPPPPVHPRHNRQQPGVQVRELARELAGIGTHSCTLPGTGTGTGTGTPSRPLASSSCP